MKPASAVRPAGSRLRPEGLAALLPRIPRGCGCWSPGASPTRPTCCPIPPLAYSRAPADPCSHSSSAPASELLAPLRPLRPKPRPSGPELPAAPHADSSEPLPRYRAASQRLTDSPSPSTSSGSSPQPPPPSLNHRVQGERGTERLPPPSRPGTSATRWAELHVAPPRAAPRWVEAGAHRSAEAFQIPRVLYRDLHPRSDPHTAPLGGVWAPSLSCPTSTCQSQRRLRIHHVRS